MKWCWQKDRTEWNPSKTVFAGLYSRCFVRQTLASSHVLTDLLCWIFASFRFSLLSLLNIKSELTLFTFVPITRFLSHILTIHQFVTPKNNMYWIFIFYQNLTGSTFELLCIFNNLLFKRLSPFWWCELLIIMPFSDG